MAINKNKKTFSQKLEEVFKEKYGKEVKELRGIIENSLTIEELIVNYNFYLTNTKGYILASKSYKDNYGYSKKELNKLLNEHR